MYVGAGTTIEARLGELISTSNLDVVTVAVTTANVVGTSISQQLDGTTFRTIVADAAGFVDEISIANSDNVTHSITVRINDGVNTRELITEPLAPGSTLLYKPGIGWRVQGPYFGSGWITSGSIGNNAVVSGSIGSGQIGSFHLTSGSIQSGKIGNAAVVSGSIASGQIGDNHFASGARIDAAEFMVSDQIPSAEPLPGPVAVTLNTSGALVIAMAGQSGRYPALGIVIDNVASGQAARRYFKGRIYTTSWNLSGGRGASFPIWLGLSGEVAVGSAPLPGGSGLNQILGFGINQSGMVFDSTYSVSGSINRFAIGSGAILSGHIASGNVVDRHLGSGSVRSGSIASGSISTNKLASGAVITAARVIIEDDIATEEVISGVRAVNISQSGRLRQAMAGVSGRMPACGVLVGNVVSGQAVSALSGTQVILFGKTAVSSGRIPTSGFGLFLYVGMSGNLVGPAGITSGMVIQRVAVNAQSGQMIVITDGRITSGLETTFRGNF
jgi:trimeric autotransporter adhesin